MFLSIIYLYMTMFSQYLRQQAHQLQMTLDMPTTRFGALRKKVLVRDVADLTVDCVRCGEATAIIDCHEIEQIVRFDNLAVEPICPSCYELHYVDGCLERLEKHNAKHHSKK